jgi:hypothetical protein
MFTTHIETWMYDAETADWLATDPGWLAAQFNDVLNQAIAANRTPSGDVSLVNYTLIGPADEGLMYDFEYSVPVD